MNHSAAIAEQILNGTRLKPQTCLVVGAPRSGTTLLHAMLCTAEGTNDLLPECSYLTALVGAYETGRRRFFETQGYFASQEDFRDSNINLIGQVLYDLRRRANRPYTLVLKDPIACKYAQEYLELIPGLSMVVSVREPLAVLTSRLEVDRKNGLVPDADRIRYIANQYRDFYRILLVANEAYPEQMLWVNYEDFSQGKHIDALERFMASPLDLTRLWNNANIGTLPEWDTGAYGKPLGYSAPTHQEPKETLPEGVLASMVAIYDEVQEMMAA